MYIYIYAETPAITVLDLGQRQHVQSEGADKDWGYNNGSTAYIHQVEGLVRSRGCSPSHMKHGG